MDNRIDISGLDKALLLMEFYNRAEIVHPAPMFFDNTKNMTAKQARRIIDDICKSGGDKVFIDTLYGRYLRISLCDNFLDPWLHDNRYGKGSAQKVVDHVREKRFADNNAPTPRRPLDFFKGILLAFSSRGLNEAQHRP